MADYTNIEIVLEIEDGETYLEVLDGISMVVQYDDLEQQVRDALSPMFGSPLTASTAAGMTDQTKVYVYTGSETGYTAGNWYYYNGSSWVSGGVYNSVAVQTDKTLTMADKAADAKKTGDELTDLKSALDDVEDILDVERIPLPTKNLNVTPYETATVFGVTFTVSNDNSTSLSGTPTREIWWPDTSNTELRWYLPAGTYTLSGGQAADAWRTVRLELYATQDSASPSTVQSCIGNAVTFTTQQGYWAVIRFVINANNSELTGKTFEAQLESGSSATTYASPWGEYEVVSTLDRKININQGVENVGKILTVDDNGDVTPQELTVPVDNTLSIEGVPADAKLTGNRIDEIKTAIEYEKVVIPSKNLNITPYETATAFGVTFTINEDNSIDLSGTPTREVWWPDISNTVFRWKLPAGTYTLSGGSAADAWRTVRLELYATQDAASPSSTQFCTGNAVTFTVQADCWASVRFVINANNSELSGKTFKAQVESGNSATTYVSPWPVSKTETKIDNVEEAINDVADDVQEIKDMISGASLNDALAPKPVIFDTDIGGDSDDALAVRTLCYYESIGAVRIVMASSCNNSIKALRGLSAMFNYDGTVDVPVILKNSNYDSSNGIYLDVLVTYPYTQNNPPSVYGATAYRKALAALTNKCVLIFVGPLTNLSALLNTTADEYSELSGVELVTEKVEKVVVMGGAYPDSVTAMGNEGATIDGVKVPGAEWNFAADIPATANVIANCPVPMIFCGWEIGHAILCGGGISDKLPTDDIVIAVLNEHGSSAEVASGRYGWDPITTAIACLNNAEKMGFDLVRGTVNYNSSNSTNTFTESSDGMHYYVSKKYNNDYYRIYMNHILAKDWWGTNNTAMLDRASL